MPRNDEASVPADDVPAASTDRDSGVSPRTWWTAILYIAAVAILLRFYDLPLKPLHHDEGVNTHFLINLVRPPHEYQYDPANYHGPSLYYFAWASVAVWGLSTVAIRLVTAFAGLATVLLLLSLRRQIGSAGALAAAALLALSPGAVYFSRYFIHEALLVCFTVATVAATVHWLHGRAVGLPIAAAAAGLMFATKETAIISAAGLLGAVLTGVVLCDLRQSTEPGWTLSRVSISLSNHGRTALAWLRQLNHQLLLVLAVLSFLGVVVLLYTSLLTHWQGAADALRSFAIWTKTGTTAHTRPWHTYLSWLVAEELPLLILGGVGIVVALWEANNRFAVVAALWALSMAFAYSVIPYKTPWLTLNIIAPLAITGGYAFESLWRRRASWPRVLLPAAAAAVAGVGVIQSYVLNFVDYDKSSHPYVYAHTSREVLALVGEIGRLEQLNPGASIAVTSRDHFPLSWYLREYAAGYYGRPTVTGDPLVVASEEQKDALDGLLGKDFDRMGSYSLRPGVRLVLYVRRDLRRSADPGR
jgi:uncharacterized protein (TIGR03663 family)